MDTLQPSHLLALPAELINHILTFLRPVDLATTSQTCRLLRDHAYDDTLWYPFVQSSVPGQVLPRPSSSPSPSWSTSPSYRAIYASHHPHWFLPQHKLWFADTAHTGKLLIARYDPRTNTIAAYALVAERGEHEFELWEHNNDVIIHTFAPKVQLDLNQPVLKLSPHAWARADSESWQGKGMRYQREIRMDCHGGSPAHQGIHSTFILARALPADQIRPTTQVWPPLLIPAAERVRNESHDHQYRSTGHRPTSLSEVSTSTFRLRRWMEFSAHANNAVFAVPPAHQDAFAAHPGIGAALNGLATLIARHAGGVSLRMGEDVATYATLPAELYTPTKTKPYQGIWVGDYSGHGCEFLIITQPDRPGPLPYKAETTLRRVRDRGGSMSSQDSWESVGAGSASSSAAAEEEDADEETSDDEEGGAQEGPVGPGFSAPRAREEKPRKEEECKGRLEAIKLTGDPNIPRGEYTFIVPEIGDAGLLRVAREATFRGARVVRSVGHVAAHGFRDDEFIPSQLILISHDRLAQYWESFGHVSFYERVDIDKFLAVE
ncbi:hypothetical protein H2201_008385 [Coniosporium apollinis]|uniref:F-box domain-containing protein n=1 Tax=Coniosporium apollinis TaxID=61459 RepID=A0ABQ9NH34_9PEZI|nr:hypothetical protein H2201_008385 [Coniosporium apollinis]